MVDEADLIRRARQGDVAAWTELYDQNYDAVYRYCYCRVSDVAQAQDLAGEVFVRMVEKLPRFDVRGRPLLAWLYTIARNLVNDVYRQAGTVTHLPLEELVITSEGNPAQDVEHHLSAKKIAGAVNSLTEDQRQVILLKFIQDYSNAEVAFLLGKPEGAVKSLQHRALAALRRILGEGQDGA
jgi:RNA polymerase sigma-70 factor (ECF subfamily)